VPQLQGLYWKSEGGTCLGRLCDTGSFGIGMKNRKVYLLI